MNFSYNISFKGFHKNEIEHSKEFNNDFDNAVNHCSFFFRYDITAKEKGLDETIIKYLKNKQALFGARPLKIVSAGSSYGEEAYSYAMALEEYGMEASISAFDISDEAIEGAKEGRFMLDTKEEDFLSGAKPLDTEFREKIQKSFKKNFELTNKKQHTYKKRKGAFQNIDFEKDDVRNLGSRYEKNSQDLVLMRYVLYHHTKDEIKEILNSAYKILKQGGLLCLTPDEVQSYEKMLKETGFIQISNEYPCIFKKPENPLENKLAPIIYFFNLKNPS